MTDKCRYISGAVQSRAAIQNAVPPCLCTRGRGQLGAGVPDLDLVSLHKRDAVAAPSE